MTYSYQVRMRDHEGKAIVGAIYLTYAPNLRRHLATGIRIDNGHHKNFIEHEAEEAEAAALKWLTSPDLDVIQHSRERGGTLVRIVRFNGTDFMLRDGLGIALEDEHLQILANFRYPREVAGYLLRNFRETISDPDRQLLDKWNSDDNTGWAYVQVDAVRALAEPYNKDVSDDMDRTIQSILTRLKADVSAS